MVGANHLLYNKKKNEHPDHVVVIKYVPFVKGKTSICNKNKISIVLFKIPNEQWMNIFHQYL